MAPLLLAQPGDPAATLPGLETRWSKDVDRTMPWPEYPRPTLVRDRWQNLNGQWHYSIVGDGAPGSDAWQGEILVPYPVESRLSGVMKRVAPTEALWYGRTFRVPGDWRGDGQRVMLNFGAVDWHAAVRVNGREVGEHKGGYDPFSLDITDALKPGANEDNEMIVVVRDPTNEGGQPRGKQWNKSHGIWYTATTGIWQTVWLEPVGGLGIQSIRASVDAKAKRVSITAEASGDSSGVLMRCRVQGSCGGRGEGIGEDLGAEFSLDEVREWSPQTPCLYDVEVEFVRDDRVIERVKSYFAIREVGIAKVGDGHNRLTLNGKPVFHFGPLDQGFWPDGLYTPPTLEAMRFDIEAAKKMGCNMLRKHVKVEPEMFYYECDRLGMMVWQDMPSAFFETPRTEKERGWDEDFPALSDEWKANFEREWKEIVTDFGSHPSIVVWVPFNEGWGQNDLDWTRRVTLQTKEWDPTRLVDCASGWTDTKVGDVYDIHVYPGPATPRPQGTFDQDRAMVLGEFGGLGLPIEGHTWQAKDNWGYVSYKSKEELTDAYVALLEQMPWLIGDGLAAAVYTQTTDVEIETNGWLTYDREVWKIDPDRAAAAAKRLHRPPPKVRVLVGQAGSGEAGTWRYTTSPPPADWASSKFDDTGWSQGRAGFGTPGTPGAIVGTPWNSTEIWLRRQVQLPEAGAGWSVPALWIHHDEDAEVYINGELAASLKGYTTAYKFVPLSREAAALLRPGANDIAVHVRQTAGGQYVDVGLVDLVEAR